MNYSNYSLIHELVNLGLDWARTNIDRPWNQAIFADEASFWLFSGSVRMWTKNSEFRVSPTVKHSAKINIWAGFSSMGTFPLCIFEHNMNGEFFVKILEVHLLAQANVFHERNWFLVQDNDPKHTCKKARDWMQQNMPQNTFGWPSQSPDINPIENLFGWIKHNLSRDRPRTKSDLKDRISVIWDSITPEFLEPYWSSMPKRCQKVIDSNGNKINY